MSMTKNTCPPSTTVAKLASIAIGGQPEYSNQSIINQRTIVYLAISVLWPCYGCLATDIDHGKINDVEKYMYFSGHFDDHSGVTMQYGDSAQWRRSMATLKATGCCQWVNQFWLKKSKWRCEIAAPKLAFKRHKTNPLLSSSKQQTA